jgi:predicted dehydrogenase
MTTPELRIGIIGAGRIADLHALAYGAGSRASIYAVCDADAEIAATRAKEWSAERSYTDYRDLLADERVDAVEVILPHHLHEEVTLAALAAGRPVSVQKPMARSVAESRRMVDAAAVAGVDLRVLENFRHYPPFVEAKRMIDEGAIGEPTTQHISVIGGNGPGWEVPRRSWLWRLDEDRCGGGPCMFDHGYHIFSIAQYLLGPVEEVFAWILTSEIARIEIDRPALVAWKHTARNRLGAWDTTGSPELLVPSKYYTNDERVQIIGAKGIIWINHCSGLLTSAPPLVLYRDGVTTEYHAIESDWGASFRIGGRDWHDHLLDGTPCEMTAAEGLDVMRFTEAAHKAASERRVVRIDELA